MSDSPDFSDPEVVYTNSNGLQASVFHRPDSWFRANPLRETFSYVVQFNPNENAETTHPLLYPPEIDPLVLLNAIQERERFPLGNASIPDHFFSPGEIGAVYTREEPVRRAERNRLAFETQQRDREFARLFGIPESGTSDSTANHVGGKRDRLGERGELATNRKLTIQATCHFNRKKHEN